MAEIASAYVALLPSARGFGTALEGQVGGQVKKSGSKIGALLGKSLKVGVGAGAASIAGLVGTALFKGFGRLKAIDQAKASLRGLRLEGKQIDRVMKSATKAVTGTAYGLDSAASAAAGALGAGVEQGKELTNYLKLVADATAQSKTDFDSMAIILNKVQGAGKLTGETLQQMTENGLYAMPMLTKAYGKNAEEIQKMVSKGEISAKRFREILKENIGGAAKESGKTFSGALANLGAALGRAGAKLQEGVFSQLPGIFSGLGAQVDKIGPFAERAGEALGGALSTAVSFLSDNLPKVVDALTPAATRLGEISKITWGKLQSGIDALKNLTTMDFKSIDTKGLGESIGSAVASALGALVKLAGTVSEKFGELFSKVDWVGIGIEIGKQAPALLLGLVTGLLNFDFGSLLKGIGDHWVEILLGVLTIAFAPSKFVGPLAKILGKIPFVGRFLAVAVRWVNELGGKLLKFGRDLLGTFWRGFTGGKALPGAKFVGKILSAISSLPGRLANWWVLLQVRMGVWALNAFEAAGRGAAKGIKSLLSFAGRLPGRILKALGNLGSLLYNSGKELIAGFARGITDKATDALNAVKKVASKIKDFFPGSPVKTGPLTSWNNGGAGKRLMGMLATGIDAGSDGVAKSAERAAKKVGKKLMKALKEAIRDKRGGLADLRSAFSDMVSGIASSFVPDLFSGSLGQLGKGLATGTAGVKAALAAIPKLTAAGLNLGGGFLQGLFASGNTQLIAALAANPALAKQYESQFNQLDTYSKSIGQTVASASAEGKANLAEQKKTNQKLDTLIAATEGNPKALASQMVKALDKKAGSSKRKKSKRK